MHFRVSSALARFLKPVVSVSGHPALKIPHSPDQQGQKKHDQPGQQGKREGHAPGLKTAHVPQLDPVDPNLPVTGKPRVASIFLQVVQKLILNPAPLVRMVGVKAYAASMKAFKKSSHIRKGAMFDEKIE